MRLLVVSQYFWPETFRVNEIVAEMGRRGHDVTVLTGCPNYPGGVVFEEYRRDPVRFEQYEGADVVRVPMLPRGRGSVRLLLNYLSFVLGGCLFGPSRLRGREFDAVFVFQLSPVTSAIPGLFIGRLRHLPVVMWVLDLWPDTLSALGVIRNPVVLRWVGRLVGAIYRRCALVLGQSRSFESNVRQWAGDSSRFRYFPGWGEAMFQGDMSAVEPAEQVRPYLDGSFNVMFAGNLGESQDMPSVLDAAEALRDRDDVRFLLVGDGRVAPWIREELVRRGIERTVVMLGQHPLEMMPAMFRGASALLVSLKAEPAFAMTIPGKVQAYLASGLPIIGMLDGEGASVIEQSGAGFACHAGDAKALAALVVRMAAMSAVERRALGARGREYSRREFDRDRLLTRLSDMLVEVSIERRLA